MSTPVPPGGLALADKAARVFWIAVHGAAGDSAHPQNRTAYGVDTPAEVISRHRPGGVVLFAWAGNTEHPLQVTQLVQDLQAASPRGALGVAIDEEGGRVGRLVPPATSFPSPRAVAAAADGDLATRRWRAGGRELAALGVTTNLAPLADLGHPGNPVLGDRTFAEEPEAVSRHAAWAVRGLREGGVAAVAKHFPGHGATVVDSHEDLPVVSLPRAGLEPHLNAFRRLLATEPPAGIMAAHLLVRALDPVRPATLSPAILTGLLREEMGYDGAVVTDSLSMAGIRTGDDDAQVAVAALAAGADVLLDPPDLAGSVQAVCAAVRAGRLAEERLDDALARAGALLRRGDGPAPALTCVGAPDHVALAAEIARRAVAVADPGHRLPLADGPVVVAGTPESGARGLADALRRRERAITLLELAVAETDALRVAAVPADVALVVVRRIPEADGPGYDAAFAPLLRRPGTLVLVEAGTTPGDHGRGPTVVTTNGACTTSLEAAADVLAGAAPKGSATGGRP